MEESVEMAVLSTMADRIEKAITDTLSKGGADSETGMGADGTPTLLIDEEADKTVFKTLDEEGLDFNVLSEESGYTDRGGDLTLIVDPLDGTYNALRGSGPYAISLAVGKDRLSGVFMGLVRNLSNGDEYQAVKDGGAKLNDRDISVSRFRPENSVFSVYLGSMSTKRCYELARNATKVRYMGCVAVEMCMVAAGCIDLCFVESEDMGHNPRISDVAAAWLILNEAGGFILNADLGPFDMDVKTISRNSLFAAGDRSILDVMS